MEKFPQDVAKFLLPKSDRINFLMQELFTSRIWIPIAQRIYLRKTTIK